MSPNRAFPIRWLLPAAFAAILLGGALLVSQLAGAQSAPRKERFNHLATGFALTGAHEQARCEGCHLQGVFKGTPRDCLQCHGNGARASGVTMSARHIPTAERCDVCHTTTRFDGARYGHAGATAGNCGRCHNGATAAAAKPAAHIVTTASCDSCHRVGAWRPASFSHASVAPGSCVQCHNGAAARGKSPVHLPTSASCDSCHAPTGWIPATRFDHAGVAPGTCAQCHTGRGAAGKPAAHVPTTASCDSCHAGSAWKPARMDHSGVVPGTCAQCHDGRLATGRTPNHIPAAASCDSCHRTTAWVPTSFSHRGVAAGSCATCHNGTQAAGKPARHVATASACDSCHTTAGWRPAAFNHAGIAAGSCGNCHNGSTASGPGASHVPVAGKACDACHTTGTFRGARMKHDAVAGMACTTCHEAGTSFFGGRVATRPTVAADPQHPQTGDCNACHTTATFAGAGGKPKDHLPTSRPCSLCHLKPGDFATATMSHAGIRGACATCHAGGIRFAGVTPKGPPANHVPTGAAPCESCHSVADFSTWSRTPMNHAAVPGLACQSCHEAGMAWFGVRVTTRPATPSHPRTGDCGTCHSTASFAGAAQKPANHLPTTQACTLCHARPPDYRVYAMSHQGITGGCATCHGAGLVFATNFSPKAPPANHLPTGRIACEGCHAPTNFTSFAGTRMNHVPAASLACQSCHEAGMSWFGVRVATRPATATHPKTGDCGGCHTTASFNVAAAKPANHIPTTQACALCHSSPPNYRVYAMSHAGIASGCATCHGPGLVFATNFSPKAPPATHIPTAGAACEACHSPTRFTSFSGTPMSHAPVASMTCATCHEAGRSWFGVTIATRPLTATHPRTGDCAACHTTATFAAPAKPANHIPTSQPCALCHTGANYSTAAMNHQGIAAGCAQCHASGLAFAGVVPKQPPANHLPTGGVPCEACHPATRFTSFAGARMSHTAVAALRCTACHERGMRWFGVSVETRPSATHFPGRECNDSGCHSTSSFDKRLTRPGAAAPWATPPGARRATDPRPAVPGQRQK